MEYVTVYETFTNSEVQILSTIFKDNGLQYRLLDERSNDLMPVGMRLQVIKEHQDRAILLLRENGFLGKRLATTNEPPSGKFWIFLFVALLIVIVVSVVIAMVWET